MNKNDSNWPWRLDLWLIFSSVTFLNTSASVSQAKFKPTWQSWDTIKVHLNTVYEISQIVRFWFCSGKKKNLKVLKSIKNLKSDYVWLSSRQYLKMMSFGLNLRILKESVPTSAAKLWKNFIGQEYVIWLYSSCSQIILPSWQT